MPNGKFSGQKRANIGHMPLLVSIIVPLVIVGLVLWVISQIPMDPTIARIIKVVVVVFVCLWLLNLVVPMIGNGPYFPAYPRR